MPDYPEGTKVIAEDGIGRRFTAYALKGSWNGYDNVFVPERVAQRMYHEVEKVESDGEPCGDIDEYFGPKGRLALPGNRAVSGRDASNGFVFTIVRPASNGRNRGHSRRPPRHRPPPFASTAGQWRRGIQQDEKFGSMLEVG